MDLKGDWRHKREQSGGARPRSAWHLELLYSVNQCQMSGVGKAFWHLLVKPHFPDACSHASKQQLRNAIHTMVADGRMAVPGLRMRVTIPQPGIDARIFPLTETALMGSAFHLRVLLKRCERWHYDAAAWLARLRHL